MIEARITELVVYFHVYSGRRFGGTSSHPYRYAAASIMQLGFLGVDQGTPQTEGEAGNLWDIRKAEGSMCMEMMERRRQKDMGCGRTL